MKSVVAAMMFKDGKTMKDVDDWDCGWMMMNLKRAREYQSFSISMTQYLSLTPWSPARTSSAESCILQIVGKLFIHTIKLAK